MDFVDKKLSGLVLLRGPQSSPGRREKPRVWGFALQARYLSELRARLLNKKLCHNNGGLGQSTKRFISPAWTWQISTPEPPPDSLGSDIATMIRMQHNKEGPCHLAQNL